MIVALLPAAGHSRRMGRPKLALPLGDSTIIEQVIKRLKEAGLREILVVVGPHVAELVPLCRKQGARTLLLASASPEMRNTIEAGLAWIETTLNPQEGDAVLLTPADHPQLVPGVVRTLIAETADQILIPTVDGKRGHPTLIPWRCVKQIRATPLHVGLNTLFRQQTTIVREVQVIWPEVLADMDTPADYRALGAAHE